MGGAYMNSSEKTAALLKILGQAPYVHGVTELSEKLECTKSGIFKILSALVQSGLAAQTINHKYTLGPAVYILGKTYEDRIGLSKMVRQIWSIVKKAFKWSEWREKLDKSVLSMLAQPARC